MPKASEHAHQVAIVKWLRGRGHHVFAVPNERVKPPGLSPRLWIAYIKRMIRQGLTPGIPDLIITHKDGRRPIMLEMKDEDGELSENQLTAQTEAMRFGWPVYTANTAKLAGELLLRLGF